jgi:hypothetical protein
LDSPARYDEAMRKHSRRREAPLTLARVDDDRWQPEAALSGPRRCPEYAVWKVGPSRERKKLVLL